MHKEKSIPWKRIAVSWLTFVAIAALAIIYLVVERSWSIGSATEGDRKIQITRFISPWLVRIFAIMLVFVLFVCLWKCHSHLVGKRFKYLLVYIILTCVVVFSLFIGMFRNVGMPEYLGFKTFHGRQYFAYKQAYVMDDSAICFGVVKARRLLYSDLMVVFCKGSRRGMPEKYFTGIDRDVLFNRCNNYLVVSYNGRSIIAYHIDEKAVFEEGEIDSTVTISCKK
jgi:hypothetical protein